MVSTVVASGSIFIIFWSGRSCFGAVFDGASGTVIPVRGLGIGASESVLEEQSELDATSGAGAVSSGLDGGLGGSDGGVFEAGGITKSPLSSLGAGTVPLEEARELDTMVIIVDSSLMAVPLTLPFSGKKQISALVNAEFSDLVPFDSDLYHKEFRRLTAGTTGHLAGKGRESNLSDISLMAMPQELYGQLHRWLDAGKIRPKIITPACSLLSEVVQLDPASVNGATLVVGQIRLDGADNTGTFDELGSGQINHVVLGLLVAGELVAERIVPYGIGESNLAPWITQFLIQGSNLAQTTFDEVDIMLITPGAALRQQVSAKLIEDARAALRGSASGISEGVGPTDTSDGKLSELRVNLSNDGNSNVSLIQTWAQLAAFQMKKAAKTKIAPNFRRPQLLKHPRMGDINYGILKVLPYVGGLIVVLLVSAFIAFSIREKQLELLKFTLRLRIQEFVPNFESPEGEEVNTLRRQNKLLDDQLKDLGTTSALNPLQAFSIISRELPAGSNITIRSINLRSNTILISGAAPDYSAVEKVERMLKRRKDIFCRIKKDTPGSGAQADKRAFSFDISLCDSGV